MLQHDGIAVAGPHAVAGVSDVLAPAVAGVLAPWCCSIMALLLLAPMLLQVFLAPPVAGVLAS